MEKDRNLKSIETMKNEMLKRWERNMDEIPDIIAEAIKLSRVPAEFGQEEKNIKKLRETLIRQMGIFDVLLRRRNGKKQRRESIEDLAKLNGYLGFIRKVAGEQRQVADDYKLHGALGEIIEKLGTVIGRIEEVLKYEERN